MNIKELLNHERYQVIAVFAICVLLLWLYSCDSKVRSISNPDTFVTRSELETEVDYYLARVESRIQDLDRKDKIKQLLINNAILFAEGGTVNPYGVMAAIIGMLGIGATVDNVRKRIVIRENITKIVKDAHTT